MKNHSGFVVVLGLALLPLIAVADRPAGKDTEANRVLAFSLKEVGGREISLADFKDQKAVVVVFTGTECPVNNWYMPRLKELHAEYGTRGVQFLAVNSNTQDSADRVAEHAKQHGLPFPVLRDEDQKVADLLKAERTP